MKVLRPKFIFQDFFFAFQFLIALSLDTKIGCVMTPQRRTYPVKTLSVCKCNVKLLLIAATHCRHTL